MNHTEIEDLTALAELHTNYNKLAAHAQRLAEALKEIRKSLSGSEFEKTWANYPCKPEKSHTDLIDEALAQWNEVQQ